MIRRGAACLLALLLGACASAPTPLPELGAIPAAFEMKGRLAVRQGDRSEIAKLRWTHKPDADLWILSSPLGNEVARIESTADGATLARAGAPVETAASFAALTERLLGIGLDPVALASWLHGGARGDVPDDWKVRLEDTQRAGMVEIARRVSAIRGDVVVRLVVDEYRVVGE
ncbi:MAG: outer membrane lipoprotein LolB [Usitatibacter sp.]